MNNEQLKKGNELSKIIEVLDSILSKENLIENIVLDIDYINTNRSSKIKFGKDKSIYCSSHTEINNYLSEKSKKLGNETVNPSQFSEKMFPYTELHYGISKREYFSGLAMQSFILYGMKDDKETAERALKYADALLEELSKE